MKTYSTAAVAIALGMSEKTIIEMTGAEKGNIDLPHILQLVDNAKIKRFDAETEVVRRVLKKVKAAEDEA